MTPPRAPSSRKTRGPAALWLALAATSAVAEPADPPTQLDAVKVLGDRRALSGFPGAVGIVEGDALRDGQRGVSLAETLVRVPGIAVLDRQNYAQDLQIQSRGYGARSTFGIRGIRLVVDGIPATALDGQGQAATFPLGSLDRIEVLRGPLALQYGNAAGGAILAETALDGANGLQASAWAGSHRSRRAEAGALGGDGDWRWRVQGSHFLTGGERAHSAAERAQVNAVARWSPDERRSLRLVLTGSSQPYTDDPLGLSREQLRRAPRGTDPAALAFDTRKRIDNAQVGARWESAYAPGRSYWLGGYGIQRDIVQFLAVPVAAQRAPTSAGGVVDVGRDSAGFDLGHRWRDAAGALSLGLELGRLDEDRKGYENFVGAGAAQRLGVRGRVRRDEDNRVRSVEAFAVADRRLDERWRTLAAVRHARMRFSSRDRYLSAGNGDDSGRLDYRKTTFSLGIARAFAAGEVFASVGDGFETPTVTELAYGPDNLSGFNRDLRAARYRSGELGLRWRPAWGEVSATVHRIDGSDEIAPATSSGGRASFTNAGDIRRSGVELGLDGRLGPRWSYLASLNWTRARFVSPFAYRGAAGPRRIDSGNRVPGVARANGYAELAWRSADETFDAALELRASSAIPVDDLNSEQAPGYAQLALRVQWRGPRGWRAFARADNLLDRDYVGSVIVNESNARFYEPGAGRGFTVGVERRR
ncbi:TonB-dependent receptor family protein [Lysobacter enzymogenes]|uniref:TonB-dependent receptor family protein n=1 Tax=Lysobacter enzymogenes TaxID=69 RepID=UPI002263BEC7|nr:TonB-dependent receptor [Lysobacter enzymogenes]UZW62184.1 TonB-dependent receptor [Lysobacter enzymogenes]